MLMLAVDVLCVNCVTAANGKRPPSQDLQSSDTHWHQTHQVEHDAVEARQGTENNDKCTAASSCGHHNDNYYKLQM